MLTCLTTKPALKYGDCWQGGSFVIMKIINQGVQGKVLNIKFQSKIQTHDTVGMGYIFKSRQL